jgi:sialic acid synthase SpsE
VKPIVNSKNSNTPYVIAELNTSHNGSLEKALEMIDAAKSSGANCIKVQSFSSESLYSKKYLEATPLAKRMFDKVSLSEKNLIEISKYCNKIGIGFSSTTYSISELDFLVKYCSPAFIKIPSMEIDNYDYLEYVSKFDFPIILSTGMSTYEEIHNAIKILNKNPNLDLTILHCTSLYPTIINDANLNNIIRLKEIFPEFNIGYSDHTEGFLASIVAVSFGAKVIEKHFSLNTNIIGFDNQMATEPIVFKQMVDSIVSVVSSMGNFDRILSNEEIEMKNKMRRSIVLSKSLKVGDTITKQDLDGKRPGNGIPISNKQDLVGAIMITDKQIGDYLEYSDFIMKEKI